MSDVQRAREAFLDGLARYWLRVAWTVDCKEAEVAARALVSALEAEPHMCWCGCDGTIHKKQDTEAAPKPGRSVEERMEEYLQVGPGGSYFHIARTVDCDVAREWIADLRQERAAHEELRRRVEAALALGRDCSGDWMVSMAALRNALTGKE